ncbi:hypothetical protein [Effusibacillus lacus]|uniref:Uncharacterized protein n=1 Tax=Effusibacillus lacus TaxID=1348429 RepID=A0A292YED1_9BACL|nr:hypothetical protein [Effusibacillus lacus]TCS76093.1 hypothetical protein EDD64_10465 [Effusibacillus lacus]GAX91392.1 hypothetical protein EFBL_3061 [Effusibacillus lacus]
MANRLSGISSTALLLAAVLLAGSIFLPWWGMSFYAPQYPEGLTVLVYPDKLEGKVDIINGLNHYIGMKQFSEDSFPEFRYLPYLIGLMALLTAAVGVARQRRLLYGLIGLFVIGGLLGIYDIHRWLVDFGTNLDPKAPIKIAPFVPPVVGKNQLANFTTNSFFGKGAYLAGIAFLLMLVPLWRDRKQ